MKKIILVVLVAFAFTMTSVMANGLTLHDPFNNIFSEDWHPAIYEGNGLEEAYCGTAVCGELLTEGSDKFFRFNLYTNAIDGVYTDLELREAEHDAPIDGGLWTPEVDSPVVLETRFRMGPGHNLDGSGGAVGTLGIGLWNNAAGDNAPNPDYDSIVFSWIDDDFTDLYGLDGLTGNAAVNLFPVHGAFPQSPIDVQDWVDAKFIWSVDENGVQHVEYFLNDESLGVYSIPVPLEGLNVVVWQDNQYFDDFFQPQYPSPTFDQTFDVDFVKVTQLD